MKSLYEVLGGTCIPGKDGRYCPSLMTAEIGQRPVEWGSGQVPCRRKRKSANKV